MLTAFYFEPVLLYGIPFQFLFSDISSSVYSTQTSLKLYLHSSTLSSLLLLEIYCRRSLRQTSKMTAPSRVLPRVRPFISARATPPRFASVSTIKSQTPPTPIEPSQTQAMPAGPFYQAMLDYKLPYAKAEEPASTSAAKQQAKQAAPAAAAAETKKTPTEQQEEEEERPAPSPPPATAAAEKAAIIFGSALAGPQSRAERLAEARRKSKLVAGVWVPPRPEEPDNCCMSGCVNCVWDQYRDDMEEWSAASAEAQGRLRERGERRRRRGQGVAAAGGREEGERRVDMSMDDDGGGSETNWVPPKPKTVVGKDMWDEELYANIPVGIREFMKTEKKLKMMHEREGTTGGSAALSSSCAGCKCVVVHKSGILFSVRLESSRRPGGIGRPSGRLFHCSVHPSWTGLVAST
ncbi:hypothetical protein SODALDRAFT_374922 [Sodiomyces alkalinus F11]|uniref:Oxidoreductase-like domain-containing protein n=1 Tax=Sodiomyces alkalinus (strain CBS 110278 / VKM F-3762 / F11) TaxID=1314773 RepID=A0A3N2Q759_SODAK|nr:hypothetical protein SODALDRAFT_374922 [Sodiomyces alkalinus F11]ROT42621.1 hypothetical protein SODALDRAFT_374922 [Sodiomyces alkalinus F11]